MVTFKLSKGINSMLYICETGSVCTYNIRIRMYKRLDVREKKHLVHTPLFHFHIVIKPGLYVLEIEIKH